MASSFEDLINTPQIQFDSFLGFSGQLQRSVQVLPSGKEIVYPAGSQIAFLKIDEKKNQQQAELQPQRMRRVGGGFAQPRARAFGGTSAMPTGSLIMTKAEKPLLEDKDQLMIPESLDTNVINPGSLIRPVLVSGHTQPISAMCLSKSGKLLVTGTAAPSGEQPEIIVWDVANKKALTLIRQHKLSVVDISISPDETYFCTLGEDNLVVFYPLTDVYNFEPYKAIAGRQFQVSCNLRSVLIIDEHTVVIGGDDYLNFISFDAMKRELFDNQVRIQLRRRFNCFCTCNGHLFSGTEQGDVIKFDYLKQMAMQVCPNRKPFPGAITSIVDNGSGNVVVGTSASMVYMINADQMILVQQNQVQGDTLIGSATAAYSSSEKNSAQPSVMNAENHLQDEILIQAVNSVQNGVAALATSPACPYIYELGPNQLSRISKSSLEVRLLQTAPPAIVSNAGITQIATARDSPRVFVTACGSFLSCFSAATGAELVRISVPNTRCLCCLVSSDGTQIISGWSDGAVRSHGPQSGQIKWIINSAHEGAVTAIAQSNDGSVIATGGEDAKIRLFSTYSQKLLDCHQGHKGTITCITNQLCDDGNEVFASGCKFGYVQSFLLKTTNSPQTGFSAELQALWNTRTEGSCRGISILRDGSQLIGVGSGGMVWFQCGENGGQILRALPLPQPCTCCCNEEQGDKCKIVVGTDGGWSFIVDWDTGLVEKKLQVHQGEIECCTVRNGVAFCGGKDGCVSVFALWE